MKQKLFVGFEYSPKHNWQELLGDPKKPGNWKEETYREKLAELRAKQQEGAEMHLIAGSVSRACLLRTGSSNSVEVVCDGVTGPNLLTQLMLTNATVFGFETLESLRLCGWSAVGANIPGWIWNSGIPASVDIVNLYTCSGAKVAGVSIADMINYWVPDLESEIAKLMPTAGKPENLPVSTHMAVAAYVMAARMELIYE